MTYTVTIEKSPGEDMDNIIEKQEPAIRDSGQEQQVSESRESAGRPWVKKTGIFLVILSFVLYGGLLLVPFIPYGAGAKAAVTSAIIVSGEASFWLGAIILGKEVVTKYRKYFNPANWFKKRDG